MRIYYNVFVSVVDLYILFCRKGREFFRMPQQMSVSLRTMLKITDCVQHKVAANNGDLLNTPQYFMDECLSLFPHM